MQTGKVEITSIEEHENGSATVQLDLDEKTYGEIFSFGFIHLLRKGIETENKANIVDNT